MKKEDAFSTDFLCQFNTGEELFGFMKELQKSWNRTVFGSGNGRTSGI